MFFRSLTSFDVVYQRSVSLSLVLSGISTFQKYFGFKEAAWMSNNGYFGSLNNFARNSASLPHCEPVAMELDIDGEREYHMVRQ